jgi:hypothetical protein
VTHEPFFMDYSTEVMRYVVTHEPFFMDYSTEVMLPLSVKSEVFLLLNMLKKTFYDKEKGTQQNC